MKVDLDKSALNGRPMTVEQAIQKLKVKLKKDGFYLDLKRHEQYTKPSAMRKEAKSRAIARERARQKRWKCKVELERKNFDEN